MIKVDKGNELALTEALKDGEGRARERRVSVADLCSAAVEAEHRLKEEGLPSYARVGCLYTVTGGWVARSYGYPAQTTVCVLVRRTRGWYLQSCERAGWTMHGRIQHGGKARTVLRKLRAADRRRLASQLAGTHATSRTPTLDASTCAACYRSHGAQWRRTVEGRLWKKGWVFCLGKEEGKQVRVPITTAWKCSLVSKAVSSLDEGQECTDDGVGSTHRQSD